jgi:uncharacterized protein (TIGR02271 family)
MQNHPNQRTTTPGRTGAAGHLARLDELNDYKVADDDPDVRGWVVKTRDGLAAGRVDGLIVDTDAMKVCYLDVELDRSSLKLKEDRHVLIPIVGARLDESNDDVLLDSTAAQLASLQPYHRGGEIAADASSPPPRESDARNFYGKRGGTGGVQRMTLSEEELAIRKQERQAGAVDVSKRVETEHFSQRVPVSHEEVTVEHRAISPGSKPAASDLSNDEVRIPLMAEEATVEKRVVPKEEVVISKKRVQGEQTVEADLKKERVDVNRGQDTKRRH